MSTLDRATRPLAEAVTDLRAIREQWGDLLAAIERPRPPSGRRASAADSSTSSPPAARRTARSRARPPRPYAAHAPRAPRPAPLNLDALDAALDVERVLFDLADTLAAAVQRPVRRSVAIVRRARSTLERALQRDGRTVRLDAPCPWCGGELTGCTRAGGESYVTCSNGEHCGAPVILDGGRRTWRGADLVGLGVAIDAAQ